MLLTVREYFDRYDTEISRTHLYVKKKYGSIPEGIYKNCGYRSYINVDKVVEWNKKRNKEIQEAQDLYYELEEYYSSQGKLATALYALSPHITKNGWYMFMKTSLFGLREIPKYSLKFKQPTKGFVAFLKYARKLKEKKDGVIRLSEESS